MAAILQVAEVLRIVINPLLDGGGMHRHKAVVHSEVFVVGWNFRNQVKRVYQLVRFVGRNI